MRLPADVGMNRQRADFCALRAFGIEPVELVDRAPEQIVTLVMLNQHHWNIVELDGVGQGDQRPFGGADHGWLIVVDPVTDIFNARGREQIGCVQRLG
jgi:hypothetical protein